MKSKIIELNKKCDKDDSEFLISRIRIIIAYINSVLVMETELPILSSILETDEYSQRRSEMDTARHKIHNEAIDVVNQINRMAVSYGLKPLFSGDISNRREVADFCFELATSYYKERM